MGEVLADARAGREHLLGGRVDVGGALLVAEALVDHPRGRAREPADRTADAASAAAISSPSAGGCGT
jgi:hypothetical protein